jgi:GDPmannose 4,6-dehydratase
MITALIFGITGQVGSFLAELLIQKGYRVHGVVRRASTINTQRIDHLYSDKHVLGPLKLHYGDVLDSDSIRRIIEQTNPDEIYNLAAQSHVRVSFDVPIQTADVTGLGAIRLFQAVHEVAPTTRIYQASSSEMFGASPPPQNEVTPFHPRSPYGCAKAFAYHAARNYREAHNMHIVNGICFNMESERRGETFVTRKITRAVGRIVYGLQDKLFLGNLNAKRDWGFAGDYVEAMWRMMQQPTPRDYVIGTGEMHTVLEFVTKAFDLVARDWRKYVEVDRSYFRPTEVDALCADASLASHELGWKPTMTFEKLVDRMVQHDLKLASRELAERTTLKTQAIRDVENR